MVTKYSLRIETGKGLVAGCCGSEVVLFPFNSTTSTTHLQLMQKSGEVVKDEQDSGEIFLRIPSVVEYAVIDIGTNKNPELLQPCMSDERCFYVGVDPFEDVALRKMCEPYQNRCLVLPGVVDFREGLATMHVGEIVECSSMLSGGKGCARSRRTISVVKFTLDRILDLFPPRIDIHQVITDCQGTDLNVFAGLVKHIHRVRSITVECQDLPEKDALFLSPFAGSCGDFVACFALHLPKHFFFSHCKDNYKLVRELNCGWDSSRSEASSSVATYLKKNPKNITPSPSRIPVKVPFMGKPTKKRILHHRSHCPYLFAAGWQNDNFFTEDGGGSLSILHPHWSCLNCTSDSSGYLSVVGTNRGMFDPAASVLIITVVLHCEYPNFGASNSQQSQTTKKSVSISQVMAVVLLSKCRSKIVQQGVALGSSSSSVMYLIADSVEDITTTGEWLIRVARRVHPAMSVDFDIPVSMEPLFHETINLFASQHQFSNIGLLLDNTMSVHYSSSSKTR